MGFQQYLKTFPSCLFSKQRNDRSSSSACSNGGHVYRPPQKKTSHPVWYGSSAHQSTNRWSTKEPWTLQVHLGCCRLARWICCLPKIKPARKTGRNSGELVFWKTSTTLQVKLCFFLKYHIWNTLLIYSL